MPHPFYYRKVISQRRKADEGRKGRKGAKRIKDAKRMKNAKKSLAHQHISKSAHSGPIFKFSNLQIANSTFYFAHHLHYRPRRRST
jgi:hypothetical protein